jgi:hypothetical protein
MIDINFKKGLYETLKTIHNDAKDQNIIDSKTSLLQSVF